MGLCRGLPAQVTDLLYAKQSQLEEMAATRAVQQMAFERQLAAAKSEAERSLRSVCARCASEQQAFFTSAWPLSAVCHFCGHRGKVGLHWVSLSLRLLNQLVGFGFASHGTACQHWCVLPA